MSKQYIIFGLLTMIFLFSCGDSKTEHNSEVPTIQEANPEDSDIIRKVIKNANDQSLTISFYKSSNQASILLDKGEEVMLEGQKPASGMWYKNDEYELRGKGEEFILTKNGEVIFKN